MLIGVFCVHKPSFLMPGHNLVFHLYGCAGWSIFVQRIMDQKWV